MSDNPSCRVYNSGALTLTSGVAKLPTFDTEIHDRWGMHSTSSNQGRITVQVPGIYYVQASIEWAANATGRRDLLIVQLNSSDATIHTMGSCSAGPSPTSVTAFAVGGLSIVAAVGDYFLSQVLQISGGDLDVNAATASSQHKHSFSAIWISAN